ncbi:MAG: Nif3-like dinuclear metal center hexameric protein [archaeon]|nr:Nif3-like dinuclear metal center hexameric protein [archaeon]
MELQKIIEILDSDFDIENIKDDWRWQFDDLFIKKSFESFRKPGRNTGLMIKNSDEVNKIYTAFAPSRYVLEEIHMRGITNTLLVVKHPFDWDGRRNGQGFIHFTERDYQLMEGMGISVYSLHVPMDKNRNDKIVSTAYAFAKKIKLKVEQEFASDGHNPQVLIGLIGKVQEGKLDALAKRINAVLDYKAKVRKVTDEVGRVAIVTGGGFVPELVQEAKNRGVNTYITGIITPNSSEYDKKNYAKRLSEINKIGINIIGCSHYLTEKWAMELSIPYFSEICKSEFIEDKEALNLLE